MGTQSRLRDPQILDVLVRLASIDQQPNLSEFEHMVEEHLGVSLGPLPTFGDILYPLLDQNHDLKQLFTIDEDDISFLPPSQTSKGRRGRGRGKGHQSPKTMSSQMRKKKLKEALANTGDSSQGLTTNQCRYGFPQFPFLCDLLLKTHNHHPLPIIPLTTDCFKKCHFLFVEIGSKKHISIN